MTIKELKAQVLAWWPDAVAVRNQRERPLVWRIHWSYGSSCTAPYHKEECAWMDAHRRALEEQFAKFDIPGDLYGAQRMALQLFLENVELKQQLEDVKANG